MRAVKQREAKHEHGIKVLEAARLALNQVGEGSSPSGPTDGKALVVQRRGFRTPGTAAKRWSAGHLWPSGVIGGHRPKVGRRDAQNVVPLRRGSSSLPLVTELLAGRSLLN